MSRLRLILALVAAVIAAAFAWNLLRDRSAAPPATIAWLRGHAPGEPWLAPPVPRRAWNPIRTQAERLILGPGHPESSLLWLQVLGISHVVSRDVAKFGELLESEHQDPSGYRVYQTPLRQSSAAVLVSRFQWKNLPLIRSLHDRTALAAYLDWANRPEAVRLHWTTDASAELEADLGPDDMILVRQDAGPGWTATLAGRPVTQSRDPIGFLLLDPAREGPVKILLAPPSRRAMFWRRTPSLPTYAIPEIAAGGILDGVRHTPPPFAPGTIIAIYGSDLGGGRARVLVGGRAVEVLHADDHQINAQLPADLKHGPAEVVIEAGEARSRPVIIEIAPI